MPRVKLPYKEGDWFSVPLLDGGLGLGRAARLGPPGVVLGYFFGAKTATIPKLARTSSLRASAAVLIAEFGDPGLLDGSWPILGQSPGWNRDEWPVPKFFHRDFISGKPYSRQWDDKLRAFVEKPIAEEEGRNLFEDGLRGYVALQRELSALLKDVPLADL